MASEALDMSARDMSGVYSEEHQRNPAEEPQPEFSVNGANADVEMKEDVGDEQLGSLRDSAYALCCLNVRSTAADCSVL